MRLAVLGILVTIGLSVGFGLEARWWIQVLAGVGAFAAACALVAWTPSCDRLIFMHRLTGE
jgi:hypothetical protein